MLEFITEREEKMSKKAEFVLQAEELSFAETVAVAQALSIAAEAVERLGKYPRSVTFIQTIAVGMYDKAMAKAQAEGLQPQRTKQEAAEILRKQSIRHLN